MESGDLTPTAFRGDPDIDELHRFFQPERQFAGDTRWTIATSLKAGYVNCFDFFNETPVVQLWRDAEGVLQAVSRISLGAGEWSYQAVPEYRGSQYTEAIAHQADAAFDLLSDRASWRTVTHQSNDAEIALLNGLGYADDGADEVYMIRSLGEPTEPEPNADPLPAGVVVRLFDESSAAQLTERGLAQVDAFGDGAPTDAHKAWIARSLPYQVHYGKPAAQPMVIAIDSDGTILSFADVFLDRANKIGEFEPVGTRKVAQRRGLAKAVVHRGLDEMRAAGMNEAVVRTGVDNHAAIAAYESAGFTITDHRVSFRKQRSV